MKIELAHRRLIVWQKSMDAAVECNRLSRIVPAFERFKLAAQLRSASTSVYANIAEGTGRRTRPDFVNFLSTARGSAMEADSHLEHATRVGYLQSTDVVPVQLQFDEVIRMLGKMMASLGPFR
jgi:four helix bundle protein